MISDSLKDFHSAIRAIVTDDTMADLSVRQLDVLLTCLVAPKELNTVRGIAAAMNVSRPAITRAMDRLCELKLLVRDVDPNDRRSIQASVTVEGSQFAKRLRRAMS